MAKKATNVNDIKVEVKTKKVRVKAVKVLLIKENITHLWVNRTASGYSGFYTIVPNFL